VVNATAVAGIPGVLLAHQGGWDEILLVVGPIALVGGLLWLARRRVTQAQQGAGPDEAPREPLAPRRRGEG
jgi:hypothetical protein